MIKVGLTGGIGSGKSFVATVFSALGIPVYDSDKEAKKLYFQDDVKLSMINEFGQEVYLSSGEINKPFLSKLIFHDKKELEKVNQIIHPRVKEHFLNWLKEHDKASYVIKEAAILFESGAYKQTNKVIAVVAPEDLRVQRVMQRDGIDEALVKKKIANQMQQSELMERSDFVIVNDEKQPLLSQIIKIHDYLCGSDI